MKQHQRTSLPTRANPISEEIIVQFWLKSAKHKKSIQGSYNLTGVGVAKSSEDKYYITQIFIGKKMAEENFEAAYQIKLKFFGPDHPWSKTTAEWLESL